MKNYKRLICFGCSFTAGIGLDDIHFLPIKDQHSSKLAWPNLIANYMGIPEVINYGVGGASNQRIKREILEKLDDIDLRDTLVMVLWTFPERAEYKIGNNWVLIGPWEPGYGASDEEIEVREALLLQEHSKENRNLDMLYHILHAQEYLINRKVDYFFDCMYRDFKELENIQPYSDLYFNYIKKNKIYNFYSEEKYRLVTLQNIYPLAVDKSHPGKQAQRIYSKCYFNFLKNVL